MGDVFVSGTLKGAVGKMLSSMGTNADGTSAGARVGRYGEQMVLPMGNKGFSLVEEGSCFSACNPTISTPVALQGATTTAWVATTPSLLIQNNDSAGGKNLLMDKIVLHVGAAGTAAAALHFAILLDDTKRYASGGTAITTAKNLNMASGVTSIATLYYAATASAATSSVRQVSRGLLRGQIPVVNDMYTLDFGGPASSAGTDGTTTIMNKVIAVPAVCVGPQQSVLVYFWGASMSASPTTEFEITWIER